MSTGRIIGGATEAPHGRLHSRATGAARTASELDEGLSGLRQFAEITATDEIVEELLTNGVAEAVETTTTALVRVSDLQETVFDTARQSIESNPTRSAVMRVANVPYTFPNPAYVHTLAFNSIRSITNDEGFIFPVIDAAYKRWKARNPNLADRSTDAYVTSHVRHGPHRVWLDALLGPTLVRPNSGRLRPASSSEAWNIFPVRAVEPPGVAWRADCLSLMQNRSALESMIEEVHLERAGSAGVPDLTRDAILDYAAFFSKEGWDATYPGVYVRDHSTLTNFTDAALQKMMGNQQLSPRELVHRLYDSHDVLEDVAQASGYAGIADLWIMPGIPALAQKVITRSGTGDHAYVFELAEIVRRFDSPAPDDVLDYRLQVPINGRDGPDIVAILAHPAGAGRLLARITELKSHKGIGKLVGYAGEIMRQPGSTLRRTWEEMDDLAQDADGGMLTKIIDDNPTLPSPQTAELMHEMDMVIDAKHMMADIGEPADLDDLVRYQDVFTRRTEQLADFLIEINTRFADRRLIDDPAVADIVLDILSKSNQKVKGRSTKISDILAAAMQNEPQMSVRKLMILRMIINADNGTYNPVLLNRLAHADTPDFVFTAEIVYPPNEIVKGFARTRFLEGG